MTVRDYQDTDLEACRALWVELTQWHRDIYEAQEIGGDDPGAAFDRHLEAVGEGNLWVAEHEGRIVGLVGMAVDGTEAELEPIVVSTSDRGRGVGRALAAVVIAEARRRELRTLSARPVGRNTDALRFFHAQGFDVLGHVELMLDLADRELWRHAETIAGRDFRA